MRLKGEILSITNLVTTSALNAKIKEVKVEIPNITNLATNTALTAVENKIPSVKLKDVTSNKNQLNELSQKVKVITIK